MFLQKDNARDCSVNNRSALTENQTLEAQTQNLQANQNSTIVTAATSHTSANHNLGSNATWSQMHKARSGVRSNSAVPSVDATPVIPTTIAITKHLHKRTPVGDGRKHQPTPKDVTPCVQTNSTAGVRSQPSDVLHNHPTDSV